MGKHLNKDPWMWKQPNGAFRLKRVSRARELQFPRPYRVILAREGAAKLCRHLMDEQGLSLGAAWTRVKEMVNREVN